MKNSEVLRLARNRIEDGSCYYVCHAIRQAADSEVQGLNLRAWVTTLLQGHNTLEGWLEAEYGIHLSGDQMDQKRRATRLAWLDWMIAYWEAQR